MSRPEGATGIVLAGGGSSRFGSDKLAADLQGFPLLHHSILRVVEVCREVIVVISPGGAEPSLPPAVPARIVRDTEEAQGPLAGLLTGLSSVNTDLVLVAGGDMPTLVTSVLVEMLNVAAEASVDAVALADADHFRPLPIVLRTGPARDAAHILLHDGERRLRALLDALRVAVIDEPTWLALDPERATLRDIDEPGDL